MPLVVVTPPVEEPLSLAEAKLQLRVTGSDDDILIQALIQAAREHVEQVTQRQLMTATYDFYLDGFPGIGQPSIWDGFPSTGQRSQTKKRRFQDIQSIDASEIEIPKPRLQSVTSIKYTDVFGAQQTLATSVYEVDTFSDPGIVRLAWNQVWPSTRGVKNSVVIRYVAGYSATAAVSTSVPASLKAAMKLLIGNWYENRESTISGTIIAKVPDGVEALLAPHRVLVFA